MNVPGQESLYFHDTLKRSSTMNLPIVFDGPIARMIGESFPLRTSKQGIVAALLFAATQGLIPRDQVALILAVYYDITTEEFKELQENPEVLERVSSRVRKKYPELFK